MAEIRVDECDIFPAGKLSMLEKAEIVSMLKVQVLFLKFLLKSPYYNYLFTHSLIYMCIESTLPYLFSFLTYSDSFTQNTIILVNMK